MTWYLCGPMSGHPEQNYPAFAQASALLRARGFSIISPHETMPNITGAISWETCLKKDVGTLSGCDGVILLDGWTKSRGALLEVGVALTLRMTILTFYRDSCLCWLDGGNHYDGGTRWNV